MRRGLWLMVVCMAAVAVWAAGSVAHPAPRGQAGSLHVSVVPALGTRGSRFLVRFRARGGGAVATSMERRYTVAATGPRRRGCQSAFAAGAATTQTGRVEYVHLLPHHRPWCLGTFHGRITLVLTPICTGPMRACPMFVIEVGTVGRFTFRVR